MYSLLLPNTDLAVAVTECTAQSTGLRFPQPMRVQISRDAQVGVSRDTGGPVGLDPDGTRPGSGSIPLRPPDWQGTQA